MDAERSAAGDAPAVTVVTITRNNLAGLQRTFASLAMQDFRNVQHVVIDGASTDGSIEWLRSAAVFPDTVVVSEPDRGVYDAMNKGARLARGSLLNFLNAGDAFANPTVLSRASASQSRDQWSWGFGLKRVVTDDGRALRPVRPVRYSLRRHALGRIEVSHQATFMRTSFFRELGGFEDRFPLAADTDLLLRAGRRATPMIWQTVEVLYAAGGVSQRYVLRSTYERHLVRVATGTVLGPWPMDLAWTVFQVAAIVGRTTLKKALNWVSRGQFTPWWAARGL